MIPYCFTKLGELHKQLIGYKFVDSVPIKADTELLLSALEIKQELRIVDAVPPSNF